MSSTLHATNQLEPSCSVDRFSCFFADRRRQIDDNQNIRRSPTCIGSPVSLYWTFQLYLYSEVSFQFSLPPNNSIDRKWNPHSCHVTAFSSLQTGTGSGRELCKNLFFCSNSTGSLDKVWPRRLRRLVFLFGNFELTVYPAVQNALWCPARLILLSHARRNQKAKIISCHCSCSVILFIFGLIFFISFLSVSSFHCFIFCFLIFHIPLSFFKHFFYPLYFRLSFFSFYLLFIPSIFLFLPCFLSCSLNLSICLSSLISLFPSFFPSISIFSYLPSFTFFLLCCLTIIPE